jgi:riboflavin-specific deaminase-like protein
MRETVRPSDPADPSEAALLRAWRAILNAAAWRRAGEASRSPTSFAVEAWGTLRPTVDPKEAWLVWQPSGGWEVGAAAPAEAHPLLDLYLPLCVASALRPLTVGHLGQSLDGHIATESGDSYYVTGPANVLHLHRMRALCDAVVVGAETVARDDPQLTVRLAEGANPLRVILDPRGRLRTARRVFAAEARTLLVRDEAAAPPKTFGSAEVLALPARDGRFELESLLERLHARGAACVFVEGGGATVSSFLEAGLLDRLQIAIAPLVTGNGRPGIRLPARATIADCLQPAHRVFSMGGDVLFDCDLRARAPTAGSGSLRRVY